MSAPELLVSSPVVVEDDEPVLVVSGSPVVTLTAPVELASPVLALSLAVPVGVSSPVLVPGGGRAPVLEPSPELVELAPSLAELTPLSPHAVTIHRLIAAAEIRRITPPSGGGSIGEGPSAVNAGLRA